jgi:hypothetical protein
MAKEFHNSSLLKAFSADFALSVRFLLQIQQFVGGTLAGNGNCLFCSDEKALSEQTGQ